MRGGGPIDCSDSRIVISGVKISPRRSGRYRIVGSEETEDFVRSASGVLKYVPPYPKGVVGTQSGSL